jgi:hypothetical protein
MIADMACYPLISGCCAAAKTKVPDKDIPQFVQPAPQVSRHNKNTSIFD